MGCTETPRLAGHPWPCRVSRWGSRESDSRCRKSPSRACESRAPRRKRVCGPPFDRCSTCGMNDRVDPSALPTRDATVSDKRARRFACGSRIEGQWIREEAARLSKTRSSSPIVRLLDATIAFCRWSNIRIPLSRLDTRSLNQSIRKSAIGKLEEIELAAHPSRPLCAVNVAECVIGILTFLSFSLKFASNRKEFSYYRARFVLRMWK